MPKIDKENKQLIITNGEVKYVTKKEAEEIQKRFTKPPVRVRLPESWWT